MGFNGEVLQVKVAAPPIKGKANKELVSFLSQVLGISKNTLTILKGHTSRNKVILVTGLSQEELSDFCLRLLPPTTPVYKPENSSPDGAKYQQPDSHSTQHLSENNNPPHRRFENF